MTIHFEELWTQAEELSSKAPMSKEEIFIELGEDLIDYAKLDNIPSKDIRGILQTKKIGEILFKLADLSRIDNVNTYAALQLEIQAKKT